MGSGPYLVVLVVGAAIVVLDGQLILRNSPGYLAEVYGTQPARRLAMLVAVFFHLVMLGLVALVASIGLSPDSNEQAIVTRIGVILLLTALGHAVTMMILSRLREEQESSDLAEAELVAQRQLAPPRRPRRVPFRDRGGRAPTGPRVQHGQPGTETDGPAPRPETEPAQPEAASRPAAERTGRRAEDASGETEHADAAEPEGAGRRSGGGAEPASAEAASSDTGRPRAHYHSTADAEPDAEPGVEMTTGDAPPPPRRQPANTRPTDIEQPRARQPR